MTLNLPSAFLLHHPPLHHLFALHIFLEHCGCLHGHQCRSVLAGEGQRGNGAGEPSPMSSFSCLFPLPLPLPLHSDAAAMGGTGEDVVGGEWCEVRSV